MSGIMFGPYSFTSDGVPVYIEPKCGITPSTLQLQLYAALCGHSYKPIKCDYCGGTIGNYYEDKFICGRCGKITVFMLSEENTDHEVYI